MHDGVSSICTTPGLTSIVALSVPAVTCGTNPAQIEFGPNAGASWKSFQFGAEVG